MNKQTRVTAGQEITRYEQARRELSAAVNTAQVKEVLDKSKGLAEYARRARDGVLVGRSTEMICLAEHRLGEIMEEQRVAGKLAKGGQPHQKKSTGSTKDPVPTLESQGIDKHLADRARKAVKMPFEKFERSVAKRVEIAIAAIENAKAVIAAARAERHATKRKKRAAKEAELADKIVALPQKKFAVIVADPEWRFEFYSENGKTNSSADNHYETNPIDVIKARDVPSIAADDCVLFLWATVPMLPQALEVMEAWGFIYKSNFVWVKDKPGTGYWFRNQHEHLLVGTRGKIPAPAEGDQVSSVLTAKVGKHSEKPVKAMEMIEKYYPTVPKIELNCRGKPRAGWEGWGNETE